MRNAQPHEAWIGDYATVDGAKTAGAFKAALGLMMRGLLAEVEYLVEDGDPELKPLAVSTKRWVLKKLRTIATEQEAAEFVADCEFAMAQFDAFLENHSHTEH